MIKRKRILTAKELAEKYNFAELNEKEFLRNVAHELSKRGFGIYIPGKVEYTEDDKKNEWKKNNGK